MKDTVFFRQAELLLRILPLIHKEEVFGLKGGTAINFFVRDLPRVSGARRRKPEKLLAVYTTPCKMRTIIRQCQMQELTLLQDAASLRNGK